MAVRELFSQNLIIESDLQDFAGHVIEAVNALGGHRLVVVERLYEIIRQAREEGAGRGQLVPAALLLSGCTLLLRWGEPSRTIPMATLPKRPEPLRIEALAERLRMATQITEPTQLLARNREMMERFEETRRNLRNEILAMQSALDQRQAELRESMRMAETDPLTGLLNRRAFDDRIEQAFRRVLRQRSEHLSLLLLDLDEFKQLNDEHGHQYGDEILKRMAQAMISVVRTDVDDVFRIGGDEFAILMYADNTTACRKAMQILHLMDKRVSIGVSSISGREEIDGTRSDFFEAADNALYESKRCGRGCITIDVCRYRGNSGCDSPCHGLLKTEVVA